MSIILSYRGTIVSPLNVTALTTELTEIADALGWPWQVREDDWTVPANAEITRGDNGDIIVGHLGLRGISLMPRGITDPLHFLFDSKGRLRDPFLVVQIRAGKMNEASAFVSLRTENSSRRLYATMIHLLHYVHKRFIPDLVVLDPTTFWETNDDDALDKLSIEHGESPSLQYDPTRHNTKYEPSRFVPSELVQLVQKIIQRKLTPLN